MAFVSGANGCTQWPFGRFWSCVGSFWGERLGGQKGGCNGGLRRWGRVGGCATCRGCPLHAGVCGTPPSWVQRAHPRWSKLHTRCMWCCLMSSFGCAAACACMYASSAHCLLKRRVIRSNEASRDCSDMSSTVSQAFPTNYALYEQAPCCRPQRSEAAPREISRRAGSSPIVESGA